MNIPSRSTNDPLEFDFSGHGSAAKINGHAIKKDVPKSVDEDPEAVVFKGPERPKHFQTPPQPKETPKESPMNATATATPHTPTAIHARQSIERQKREQKTTTAILGGAATSLVLFVLVVGALAALGGYVLWKQIDRQSATIALLEANMRQEMISMRSDLEKTDQQISKDVMKIQTSMEDTRTAVENLNAGAQTQRDKNQRQDLQINQLDQRLRDIEKVKYFKR